MRYCQDCRLEVVAGHEPELPVAHFGPPVLPAAGIRGENVLGSDLFADPAVERAVLMGVVVVENLRDEKPQVRLAPHRRVFESHLLTFP